jgi:hypothetical protein
MGSEILNELKKLNDKIDKFILSFENRELSSQKVCSYSFYDWLDEWFNVYKIPNLKSGSLKEIEVCIRKHIKPNIKDKFLNEITGLDIQKALNNIKQSRTKKYVYNVYNGSFKQAVKLKLISENPMLSVDGVQHNYKNGKALTVEQQINFLKLIENNRYKLLYRFYVEIVFSR